MAGVELEKVVNFDGRNLALVLLREETSAPLPRVRFLLFDKRSSTYSMRWIDEYIAKQGIPGRFVIGARV
jgi:hypothetical protein